ncbi:MAG TPA: hypothetical protein VK778_08365 [Solirubrobacteraceae bacterium]|jgi:hypothetical protein|nr:hypothetical protein [Solirubrobacteraceae bacterium]
MPIHTTYTRDAALSNLHRINRWLLAGSVVLTGALTDVAAHAFPGKTLKRGSTADAKRTVAHASGGAGTPTGSSNSSTGALAPPAQAPQATGQSPTPSQEATQAGESAPAQESTPPQEAAPVQESAPPQAAPAPEASSEPAPETNSEPEPVVSGGS